HHRQRDHLPIAKTTRSCNSRLRIDSWSNAYTFIVDIRSVKFRLWQIRWSLLYFIRLLRFADIVLSLNLPFRHNDIWNPELNDFTRTLNIGLNQHMHQ